MYKQVKILPPPPPHTYLATSSKMLQRAKCTWEIGDNILQGGIKKLVPLTFPMEALLFLILMTGQKWGTFTAKWVSTVIQPILLSTNIRYFTNQGNVLCINGLTRLFAHMSFVNPIIVNCLALDTQTSLGCAVI